MGLPTSIADALIAAGGCAHTPEPQKACDTCGRPPVAWAKPAGAQVLHYDFRAETLDGRTIDKRDVLSVGNLPLDEVCRLRVLTDNPRIPLVSIGCDPRQGERLRMFTRHATRLATGNGSAGGHIAVLVLEVVPDGAHPEKFTRLYLHPTLGPILTTEDLYF